MSWLNDLSSVLGIPASATAVAGGIYSLSLAAESQANEQALLDISQAIKNSSWTDGINGIAKLFSYTFGKRHFSFKCVTTSVSTTIFFMVAFTVYFFLGWHGTHSDAQFKPEDNWMLTPLLLVCFVADYIALGKTRYMIGVMARSRRFFAVALLDIFLTILIACSAIGLLAFIIDVKIDGQEQLGLVPFAQHVAKITLTNALAVFSYSGNALPIAGIMFWSTFMTSIWVVITLIASIALILLSPLRSFICWFFPIDEHPIRAIGVTGGLLVWITALLLTLYKHAQ